MFDIRRQADDMYEVFYNGVYEGTVWGEGNKNVLIQAVVSRENPAPVDTRPLVLTLGQVELVVTQDPSGVVTLDGYHIDTERTVFHLAFNSIRPFCSCCGSLREVSLVPLEDETPDKYYLHCPKCANLE